MWSSARASPAKLSDVLAREGGVARKELNRTEFWGVPNVGETERGRFSSEDKLGGGGEGGCGEDSGLFRRWNELAGEIQRPGRGVTDGS